MDARELRGRIDAILAGLVDAAANADAQTDFGKMYATLVVGVAVVGELVLDVKRIADAAERLQEKLDGGKG